MSRTALRKELLKMDADQLRAVIADAYDARPEIKEYFDFFLNPDVDRLFDKTMAAVNKETQRTRWGYSKMRVTVLKKLIRDFAGFNPGPEHVLRLYSAVLLRLAAVDRVVDLSPVQERFVGALVVAMLGYADAALLASEAIAALDSIVANKEVRRSFRDLIVDAIGGR